MVGESSQPPLVAHVIYNLRLGGLENGLVNLINNMPEERYRHAVVCLKDYSDFRHRIQRGDVDIIALHRRDGKSLGIYARLTSTLAKLRPKIVHSRNLAGLDSLLPAKLIGIPCRIHSEHGRDMYDLHGHNRRQQLLRKLHRPLVDHYIGVSADLCEYLHKRVGVPRSRISQIYNGVDTRRFHPKSEHAHERLPQGFANRTDVVIGTVGRMQSVKDPCNLVRAFSLLCKESTDDANKVRLVMVGDGPLRGEVEDLIMRKQLSQHVWLAGERDDVPELMQSFDVFALPSLAEGISNTVLEAMASGLPIAATNVGGNGELIRDGHSGLLAPPDDSEELARILRRYVLDKALRLEHGRASRTRAETEFSLSVMVDRYQRVYDQIVSLKAGRSAVQSAAARR